MTSADFEAEVPVSQYGRARREAWLAQLAANADMMTQAAMQAHEQDHLAVTAGQAGLYGHLSGQERAASVAARPVTVGTDWGDGRQVQRNGGLFNSNVAPAPARVYRQDITERPGISPLRAWMEGR
jgi:hypothetical protein